MGLIPRPGAQAPLDIPLLAEGGSFPVLLNFVAIDFDMQKGRHMENRNIKNNFGLPAAAHLILIFLVFLFLSGSAFGADEKSNTDKDTTTATKLQGTLSGKWKGELMGEVVTGTFSVTITAQGTISGTFSGPQSGTITGTIGADGEIEAKGSAGISDWSGKASLINGRLSGSGTWTGYGGVTGSWSTD